MIAVGLRVVLVLRNRHGDRGVGRGLPPERVVGHRHAVTSAQCSRGHLDRHRGCRRSHRERTRSVRGASMGTTDAESVGHGTTVLDTGLRAFRQTRGSMNGLRTWPAEQSGKRTGERLPIGRSDGHFMLPGGRPHAYSHIPYPNGEVDGMLGGAACGGPLHCCVARFRARRPWPSLRSDLDDWRRPVVYGPMRDTSEPSLAVWARVPSMLAVFAPSHAIVGPN